MGLGFFIVASSFSLVLYARRTPTIHKAISKNIDKRKPPSPKEAAERLKNRWKDSDL
jgi:hypothetical protein|tara:strand:+ start:355 stop:525 length:171 start_codon:yes stop_codon:yes gene_type:complete